MNSIPATNPLSAIAFPRTGKRGVPQQFPRRLYEMLDSETRMLETTSNHPKVIAWSPSGRSFRIFDVNEFSETVLPKYFRTKKFSSFQRNLNLYGFAKVRRGIDIDAYAHDSFLRNQPTLLMNLRKLTSSASSRKRTVSKESLEPRSESPSTPAPLSAALVSPISTTQELQPWDNHKKPLPRVPHMFGPRATTEADRGKLDLLALALEREAYATVH